jgi:hemolysin D
LQQSTAVTARQVAQRAKLRIEGTRARLGAAQSNAQLARKRLERTGALRDRGFASHATMDQASSEVRQAESQIEVARSELAEAEQAEVQARSEASSAILRGQDSAVTRLETIRAQVYELRTEAAKLATDLTDCTVRSPASGRLFWLETLAPGAWLRSATPLSKVVPENRAMIIEAQLRNQDIPFVHAGQRAVLKLNSLPFQRFGTLNGRVRFVAPDSVEGSNGDSFYKIEVEITSIPDEMRQELPTLISGLDVQVNVITDKRRLISYFFDPIFLAIQESFHER